jgi:uncharacterized protein YceK
MKRMLLLMISCVLSGCAVIAVADLAVTTAATVAKAGVKTVGAAVDAVTSEKKDKAKDK